MNAESSYFDCSFFSIHYIICECGKTFPSENDLKSHLAKEHPHKRERKEYKCGVCGSTFKTEEACITHYEQDHITNEDVKEEYLDDDSEDTKPDIKPDLAKLEEHTNADEYMYHVGDEVIEEVIDEELVSEEVVGEEVVMMDYEEVGEDGSQVLHIPEEFGQVIQKQDGQLVLFVNKQRSKNVASAIPTSPDDSNDSKRHNFTVVNEYLRKANIKMGLPFQKNSSYAFVKNVQDESNDGRVDDGTQRKNPKKRVCEVCGRNYSTSAALRYHQRVHTGEKPYACNYCPKRFTMPFFLKIHVRTHTGERPYLCPHCPKAFYSKAALLRHIRIHTGERPYPCPMCGKTFAQSNAMKLHVSTVHLKQPDPYKSKKRRLKADENKSRKGLIYSNELKPKIQSQKFAHSESDLDVEELVYEVIESEEIYD